jgi:hypothetical protein
MNPVVRLTRDADLSQYTYPPWFCQLVVSGFEYEIAFFPVEVSKDMYPLFCTVGFPRLAVASDEFRILPLCSAYPCEYDAFDMSIQTTD